MKVLVAEDDPISRRLLEARLSRWGFEVVAVGDGEEAWQRLQGPAAPRLAVIDWMMPHIDGVDLCQRLRQSAGSLSTYIILLTTRDSRADLIAGLRAGADDYVTKPFDPEELRARLQVGVRVVELQQSLADRVKELEEALARVKQLQGLLPICAYCKKIRDDQNYWQQLESYVAHCAGAQFSHSICPDCYVAVMGKYRKELSEA